MPAGASFCVRRCRIHGIAEEMLSHQPGKRQAEWGVRQCHEAVCWYVRLKIANPLFVGQFDGTAEQAQLPGNVYAKYWCARRKRQKVSLPVIRLNRRSANQRREVSSRYGQYPALKRRNRSINVDYFSCVSLAMQNKTLLFSLDDTLVNNALQTLNKTRPAMVDVIPTDGIVPLYINPQGIAKLAA